jgi:branched-chain amino acid transport system ATP-binding protein
MRNVLLKAEKVKKSFGMLVAVDDCSYELLEGEFAGIVGPNGAGKTTFFNLLTGYLIPDSGRIFFRGKDATKLPPHKRVKMGMARTFQLVSVIPSLTINEHIILAQTIIHKWNTISSLGELFKKDKKDKEIILSEEGIRNILEIFGLDKKIHRKASELSYGEKRYLEILMAIILNPTLLLLDEPLGGLSDSEANLLLEVLSKIRKDKGLTILIIEHKVSKILPYITKLSFMVAGKIIIEGKPEEVVNDKLVKKIYWGVEE